MPDSYQRGEPHYPAQTLTGHFLGMYPVNLAIHAAPPVTDLTRAWYRADEVIEILARSRALEARVAELTKQTHRKRAKG